MRHAKSQKAEIPSGRPESITLQTVTVQHSPDYNEDSEILSDHLNPKISSASRMPAARSWLAARTRLGSPITLCSFSLMSHRSNSACAFATTTAKFLPPSMSISFPLSPAANVELCGNPRFTRTNSRACESTEVIYGVQIQICSQNLNNITQYNCMLKIRSNSHTCNCNN